MFYHLSINHNYPIGPKGFELIFNPSAVQFFSLALVTTALRAWKGSVFFHADIATNKLFARCWSRERLTLVLENFHGRDEKLFAALVQHANFLANFINERFGGHRITPYG